MPRYPDDGEVSYGSHTDHHKVHHPHCVFYFHERAGYWCMKSFHESREEAFAEMEKLAATNEHNWTGEFDD